MQIVFHAGAHFTDNDRVMKCLLRNKPDFATRGVAVPGPGRYRKLLRDVMSAMRKAEPRDDAREVLMDALLDDAQADRMILSSAHFLGVPAAGLRKNLLYPVAGQRMAHLRALFAEDTPEMFLAIRNPATLLPAVFKDATADEIARALDGADPAELMWSEMIGRIRLSVPDMPITVWCYEDTPLIWAQIIREIADLPAGEKIVGGFDLLQDIMSAEGMRRFRGYLKRYPVMTEAQKRRVILALLDKFALPDALEEELDLTGWTDDLVDDITDTYDADLEAIRAIPGVDLIEP
ncbi:MAG: hypothetical protein NXH82_14235 [Rhodobacteraceae bacterium]|nr:hypothetical protein [Paracoccaceae bacterium]